jgi:large subunit ribosomal protein L15
MRTPKLKGFTNPFRTEYQPINVSTLVKVFPQGGVIDVDALITAGLVHDGELVKILGQGDLSVSMTITAHKLSKAAVEKITAAGGTATTL